MEGKLEPYKGIAVTYEEIRPSYPEQLIEDIKYLPLQPSWTDWKNRTQRV